MKDRDWQIVVFVMSFAGFALGVSAGRVAEAEKCRGVVEETVANRVAVEQCLEAVERTLVVGQRLLVECER